MDGEASMTSWAHKANYKRDHGTILQQAPKHSLASMGVVERAHWEVQIHTRTMKSQVAGAYQIVEIGHARTQSSPGWSETAVGS